MKTIQQAPIKQGNRVFIRIDMDVPIIDGKVQEFYRLDANLNTIRYVIDQGAMPVLAGHMGQPQGKIDPTLSTKQLLPYFEEKLGKNKFELLENLRFDPREKENSLEFAKELAQTIDIYVNESFATDHREHTSIVLLPTLLPAYAGFHLQKEVTILEKVKKEAQKPFVVIIGGSKLESKMPVINTFLNTADMVLLGSKIGPEWSQEVPSNLVIPLDYATNGKDVGSKTIQKYCDIIKDAKTVLWAGPLGVYEDPKFIRGTKEIAQSIIDANAWSIVGGGDTVAALDRIGLLEKFNFVSTGGGAMLEFLAKDTLPGIETLK